jgi:hypothetical protein
MLKAPLHFIATAFAIAVFVESVPTFAADAKKCAAYVAEAVATANNVQARNCGFDPNHPQWSTDPNVHRRWCKDVKDSAVDWETQHRRGKAMQCRRCREYAEKALASVATAIKNGCTGLDGPRWSSDEQVHFGWCMGLKEITPLFDKPLGYSSWAPLVQEEKERDALVGDCVVQKAKQPFVAEPSPPDPKAKGSEGAESTARQAPGPRTAGTVDTAQTDLQTKKRKRVTGKKPKTVQTTVQTAAPCKPGEVNDPCKPKPKIVTPGLLEGGVGLGTRGPATAGTPLQTGAPQLYRGGGGSGPR